MLKREIERLREHLNEIVISSELSNEEIQRVSKELDHLIWLYLESPEKRD